MKTPGFWYPQQDASPWPALLLSPLSLAFEAGTRLRRAIAKPYRARVPVICIGNAVAGGAGKTPTALAVAQLLKERGEKPVFVTRGYGGRVERKGQNATCVDPGQHSADDVGDEALLLAASAPTWVCRDRVEAIRRAEKDGTFIIMDDGFQNPSIMPRASLLVIDGEAGIGNGRLIPAGPLREPFDDALKRATAVIMIGRDRQKLAARVNIPVFQARLQPQLAPGFPSQGRFVAFAGIGRPQKFYDTARDLKLNLAATVDFDDHHAYTAADIDMLRLMAEEQGARLLTTEKDAVRLPAAFCAEALILPVRLAFDDSEATTALARLCF